MPRHSQCALQTAGCNENQTEKWQQFMENERASLRSQAVDNRTQQSQSGLNKALWRQPETLCRNRQRNKQNFNLFSFLFLEIYKYFLFQTDLKLHQGEK